MSDRRALQTQLALLSAACHRVLQGDEDELSRQALLRSLAAFTPHLPPDVPALAAGLANAACARARILSDVLRTGRGGLREELVELCRLLADLDEALDRPAGDATLIAGAAGQR